MPEASGRDTWLGRTPGRPPLVVAHRGASGRAPENTLAAFRLALALGVPALECDVHLSRDGVPVVIHDDGVERISSGVGAVSSLTLAELRHLDAGSWFGHQFAGEPIPTLEEVLALASGRARVFVELKLGGGSALVEAALAATVRSPPTDMAVISFDPRIIREVCRRRPDLPCGFLVPGSYVERLGARATVQATAALGASFLSPWFAVATERLVHAAHRAGLAVSVWTVDDLATIEQLAAVGVDAVTTNHPEAALALFASGGSAGRFPGE